MAAPVRAVPLVAEPMPTAAPACAETPFQLWVLQRAMARLAVAPAPQPPLYEARLLPVVALLATNSVPVVARRQEASAAAGEAFEWVWVRGPRQWDLYEHSQWQWEAVWGGGAVWEADEDGYHAVPAGLFSCYLCGAGAPGLVEAYPLARGAQQQRQQQRREMEVCYGCNETSVCHGCRPPVPGCPVRFWCDACVACMYEQGANWKRPRRA